MPDIEATGWVLDLAPGTMSDRVLASLTALSSGGFGTRIEIAGHDHDDVHTTVAAGVFDSEEVPDLLPGPIWSHVHCPGSESRRLRLDLRRGLLETTRATDQHTLHSTHLVSARRPGVHALRVVGPRFVEIDGPPLVPPMTRDGVTVTEQTDDEVTAMTVTSQRGTIDASASEDVTTTSTSSDMELIRIACYSAGTTAGPRSSRSSRDVLDEARRLGFDQLVHESATVWDERWRVAAIDLPARPDLELALRFAQFHLLSSSHAGDDAAVGARGLTGPAYRGHVFWDTDIFVVPALTAMAPSLARAALGYRWHRLEAARRRAVSEGRAGARFPWESADTGAEAAPTVSVDLRGETIPVRTGQQEEHIVADIAWAAANYVRWTGDREFERGRGAEILMETARYWQSRVTIDPDGTGHIRGVIGPDEYHENIDDNTFTNEMARWNLRYAAEVLDRLGRSNSEEWAAWRKTSDRLVGGFDADRGVHEQFAGFFELDPVLPSSLGTPPLPADVLVGHDRIQQLQIIKQPDVMMLHHLLPDSVPVGSLPADLDYYLPRTAHGSSLSPAITAANLARVGRVSEAVRWFELAARFDLDDLSGTTAGGLHLATMGGLWQAFHYGILGLEATSAGLVVEPVVPEPWGAVTHRFSYRGVPVQIRATVDEFVITSPSQIRVRSRESHECCGLQIKGRRGRLGWELR